MNTLPDHVTRYNHRRPGLLDAPRVYRVRTRGEFESWALITLSVAVMIAIGVMLLQVA